MKIWPFRKNNEATTASGEGIITPAVLAEQLRNIGFFASPAKEGGYARVYPLSNVPLSAESGEALFGRIAEEFETLANSLGGVTVTRHSIGDGSGHLRVTDTGNGKAFIQGLSEKNQRLDSIYGEYGLDRQSLATKRRER